MLRRIPDVGGRKHSREDCVKNVKKICHTVSHPKLTGIHVAVCGVPKVPDDLLEIPHEIVSGGRCNVPHQLVQHSIENCVPQRGASQEALKFTVTTVILSLGRA